MADETAQPRKKAEEGEITQLKQKVAVQEKELQALQSRFTHIIRENPYPAVLFDPTGRVLGSSDEFLHLSGYERSRVESITIHDIKFLARSGQDLSETVRTRQRGRGEVTIEFPSGVKVLETGYLPLLTQQGTVEAVFVFFNDLTALRRQLDELREIQQTNEAIIQQNPFPILVWDKTMKVASFNQAFVDVTGFSREMALTLSGKDFHYISQTGGSAADAVHTRRPNKGEAELEFPSGTKHVERYNIPLLDVEGNIRNILTVYNDVTALQRQMEEMKSLKDRADAIIRENPYPILLWDPDLRIVAHNTAFENLGGYTREQAERLTVRDFKYIRQSGHSMAETFRDAIVEIGEVTVEFPSGERTLMRHSIPLRDDQGRVANVLSVYNDLTDQKRAIEDILAVSDKAHNGDLTARTNASSYQGDFQAIAKGINELLDTMVQPILLMNAQVQDLASSAEEANASIEEVSSGSAHIAKNASAVSVNAEKSGYDVQQVLRAMEDLATTVAQVAQKAEAVSHLAQDANKLSISGSNVVQKADKAMAGIMANGMKVQEIVTDIKSQMDRIGKIVGLISDLASQTNLLALNAAIEAARAGDAGRGFAVVATEVKSLAQESRGSAENIAEMIGGLQKISEEAAKASAEAYHVVQEGSEALVEALGVFRKIAGAIDTINRNMEEVAGASEEQAASVEQITASVNEVNSLVGGTAREAMDAAAASEESSAAIDQIAKVVGNLNLIVDKVSREMSRFKV